MKHDLRDGHRALGTVCILSTTPRWLKAHCDLQAQHDPCLLYHHAPSHAQIILDLSWQTVLCRWRRYELASARQRLRLLHDGPRALSLSLLIIAVYI